jgi:hypothetical protein
VAGFDPRAASRPHRRRAASTASQRACHTLAPHTQPRVCNAPAPNALADLRDVCVAHLKHTLERQRPRLGLQSALRRCIMVDLVDAAVPEAGLRRLLSISHAPNVPYLFEHRSDTRRRAFSRSHTPRTRLTFFGIDLARCRSRCALCALAAPLKNIVKAGCSTSVLARLACLP